MKLKAKIPILKKVEYKKYFNQIGLKNLVKESLIKRNILLNQLPEDLNFTLPPELNKLYFLHQFILLNKRINILEFGSGWSSVIFSHSLNQNKNPAPNKEPAKAVYIQSRSVAMFCIISHIVFPQLLC